MSKKNQGAALVVIMKLLRLFMMLPCLALVEAELLDSFTVCVRFKITHFSYNFLTLESRDYCRQSHTSTLSERNKYDQIVYFSRILSILYKCSKLIQNLFCMRLASHNIIRGHKFVQYSLANLKQGWPLVNLYTFQSSEAAFYMLRKSSSQLGDSMDGIILPQRWHHLCVAMDGASNIVRGVSVSKQ